MSVLFLTIPIAILLGSIALFACVRCIRGGQYEDLDTQAMRILIDERIKHRKAEENTEQNTQSLNRID